MNHQENGPAPDAAGNGPNADTEHLNDSDGRAARQLAFDLFREHRGRLVAEACRIMVERAKAQGQATIEDVRTRMRIPEDLDPRWLGVVPSILARKGILRLVGYVKTDRAKAHARPIGVWEYMRDPRPGELPNAPDEDAPAQDGAGVGARPPRPDGRLGGALAGDETVAPTADGRPALTLFPLDDPARPPEQQGRGRDGRARP